MGKHTARDDSTVDPLVADALARRGEASPASHSAHTGGSTGWPEPAPGGGGAVGWPDDTSGPARDDAPQDASDRGADEATSDNERTADAVLPMHLAVRRGWRRLFGTSPAA